VLEFVYGLKKLGYPLKSVTTDSYQGVVARQILKRNGVKSEHLSVETSKEPYLVTKNLILTESLIGYENKILIKELGGLREYKKKIDKGKGNTDDLSGALAGALYTCVNDNNFKSNKETMDYLVKLQQNNNNLKNNSNILYSSNLDDALKLINQFNNYKDFPK
jgi:hypothetical protein